MAAVVYRDFYWEYKTLGGVYDGVAALSSTDSSQSSATSDFTEPCSPPSPDTPRSCTPLQPGPCCPCGHGYASLPGPDPCPGVPCCVQGTACCTTRIIKHEHEHEHVANANGRETTLIVDEMSTTKTTTKTKTKTKTLEETKTTTTTTTVASDNAMSASSRLCPPGEAVVVVSSSSGTTNEFVRFRKDCSTPSSTTTLTLTVTSVVDGSRETSKAQTKINMSKKLSGDATTTTTATTTNATTTTAATTMTTTTNENDNMIECQWDKCSARLKNGAEVVEHLQAVHVASQMDNESFVCLWSSCKVYKKSSCSFSWLERHVVTHAGNKPYQCIVDGCGHRFTTQGGLERHVNGHFNQQTSSNAGGTGATGAGHASTSGTTAGTGGIGANASVSSAKRKDETPTKVLKKKKLVRYRRRSCAVKTEDFFDAGIMESVQQHLVALNGRTQLDISGGNSSITFHSSIRARRIEGSGKVRVLLHWHPENICDFSFSLDDDDDDDDE